MGKANIKAFCAKKFNLIWVGVLTFEPEEQPVFYYDNEPTAIYRSSYVGIFFGLTKKDLLNRMSKKAIKLTKGEEKWTLILINI